MKSLLGLALASVGAGSLVLALENPSSRMSRLGRAEISLGEMLTVAQLLRRIESVRLWLHGADGRHVRATDAEPDTETVRDIDLHQRLRGAGAGGARRLEDPSVFVEYAHGIGAPGATQGRSARHLLQRL